MEYEEASEEHTYASYGTTDPEKIAEISEAQSHGQEVHHLNFLNSLVKEGPKPNIKDIACALRTCSRAVWPEELRIYTSDLLIGKARKSSRKPIFSKDGVTTDNNFVMNEFKALAVQNAVKFLKSQGRNNSKSVDLLCKAHALGYVDLERLNYKNVEELNFVEIETLWKKRLLDEDDDDDSVDEEFEKWISKVKHIIHPRNKRKLNY